MRIRGSQGSREHLLPCCRCPATRAAGPHRTLLSGAALCAMLAASACGSAGVKRLSPSPSAPDPKTKLLVTYWPHGDGAGGKLVWTLTCQPAGGDHPHAHVACAELGSR